MAKTYQFSPFGIAVHPWVNKPDTKFNADGVFKTGVRCKLSDPGVAAFKEKIDAAAEEYFNETTAEMTAGERKKWSIYCPYTVEEDDEGNPTGFIEFDFKQNAKIKLKDGTIKDVTIALKDAKNKDMHKPVFGGSEIRTMFTFRGIKMTSAKEAGVRMDFGAVQVKKLSEGSGGGRGFGVVEGYEDDGEESQGFPEDNNTSDGDY